jgi:hypothetical protein
MASNARSMSRRAGNPVYWFGGDPFSNKGAGFIH